MAAISLGLGVSVLMAAGEAAAQTRIIDNGPDASKKVLVVMGDGYAAGADQTKFNGDVDRLLTNGVFGNDFFRENQNAFNVIRLNLISTESGVSQRVYDENGTPEDARDDRIVSTTMRNTALKYIWSGSWAHCWLEPSPETAGLVAAALATVARHDFVVVMLNQDSYGGCGGGGFQIVPRGVSWEVLAHEYGHGVGGLNDEYFLASRTFTGTANGPNCSTILDRTGLFWNRFVSPATAIPTTLGAGIDPNRTVGMFEGCATNATGIYRPVDNCRMRSNTPRFCPVCYTYMKKALFPFLGHNFSRALDGDFNGDGRSDVLIHNGQDLAIYTTSATRYTLDHTWAGNNIVPAAPGGMTWQPAANDQYLITDFSGDGKDDVVVFNGTDWPIRYLGLLRSTGSGLEGVARYDGTIPGFWTMAAGDKLFAGDFDGDGKRDVFIFNGADWAVPYLGLLRSTGAALTGTTRHDGSVPGWTMQRGDRHFVGDFDGDGRDDLYVFNGTDWGPRYFAMLRSTGTSLAGTRLFADTLPGWTMADGDQFHVGDLDADGRDDLYVFNGTNWGPAYLLMARSTGADLAYVRRYDSGSAAANIPGWSMRKGDRFFVSDADKDGRADLFVSNPATDWATEYLGTLRSSGTALSGSWSSDWVGGWNLGRLDQILATRYEGGAGRADIFIRNPDWFGLLRRAAAGFVQDRGYFRWIYTPLYDSKPWSDSMP